jgi:hypothetical protein
MKKVIYILLISSLFWAVACYKCDERVEKHLFSQQDYEWQIYDLNQIYSFKSTKTGEVKTYSVIKAEKKTLRSNRGTDKWGCLIDPRQQEMITIEMANSEQKRIILKYEASSSYTMESRALIYITFSNSSTYPSYPIGYINKNQSTFVNAQPISPDYSIIFYNQLDVNGFTYQNVYKTSDYYYSKTWGIIQFTVNDETWQRV